MPPDMLFMLDEDKRPVSMTDVLAWGRWFETADRLVARTELLSGRFVVTIFVGVRSNPSGPPRLFETLLGNLEDERILGSEGTAATWEEALANHQAVVARESQAID